MNDRIHEALDGDLPPDRVRGEDASELEAYEEAVAGALAGLRSEPVPDVKGRVMRRVAEMPAYGAGDRSGIRRAWDALWRPRVVVLRPAWGLAMAAICALLLVAVLRTVPGIGVPGQGTMAAGDARVFVHFRVEAPDARSVELAGDFTDWEPRYSLHPVERGVWSLVLPIEPGVHQYAFRIDGERWVADPLAPAVDDGFGGTNSRLDVLAPERRSS